MFSGKRKEFWTQKTKGFIWSENERIYGHDLRYDQFHGQAKPH